MEKLRILTIDDEPTQTLLLELALRRAGYEVFSTNYGKEGLPMAVKLQPDLIIVDLMMPEISGWDVIVLLKENSATNKIPIFICSGYLTEEYISRAMRIGVAECLYKSTPLITLIDRINNLRLGIYEEDE